MSQKNFASYGDMETLLTQLEVRLNEIDDKMETDGSNAHNHVNFKNRFTVGIRDAGGLGVGSVSEGGIGVKQYRIPTYTSTTGTMRDVIYRSNVYLPEDLGIKITLYARESPGSSQIINEAFTVYFESDEQSMVTRTLTLVNFNVTLTCYYDKIIIEFYHGASSTADTCYISYYIKTLGNIASGLSSHASGIGLVASTPYSFVVGKYNDTNDSADKIFTVGNGNGSESRSNAFAVGLTGGIEEKGAAYTMRGILDGEIYKSDGTSGEFVELEDGAVYLFSSVTRLISTGAWRGMNNYVIATQFNPSTGTGTGSSTTAQGAPQITAIGAAGTVGLTMAKLTYQDSYDLYHSKIGFGSCTTNCRVRWSLKKLCGSETEFY